MTKKNKIISNDKQKNYKILISTQIVNYHYPYPSIIQTYPNPIQTYLPYKHPNPIQSYSYPIILSIKILFK